MQRSYTDIIQREHLAPEHCPGYRPDRACAAVAWAALTGDDVDMAAYILYDSTGKPPGQIPWKEYIPLFKCMGYAVEDITHLVEARTVRTLERELTEGRFLVGVSGGSHAVAIVDGLTVDRSRGRLYRVNCVWRITDA